MRHAKLLAAIALCSLSACGGGDSSELNLTLSPSKLTATFYEGDRQAFAVEGSVTGTVSENVYVVIDDSSGIFDPDVGIEYTSANVYTATLKTSADLKAGDHRGSIAVKLCPDLSCSHVYGHATLQYAFSVLSSTNLTPLSPLVGAPNWSGYQGNAAHTGFVPVTLDPTQFNRRWLFKFPTPGTSQSPKLFPVTTAGGKVVLSTGYSLSAIRESDGQAAWQNTSITDVPSGMQYVINAPAASEDTVYVETPTDSYAYPRFWGLDLASGVIKFKFEYSYQRATSTDIVGVPSITNGVVYGNCCGGSIAAFDPASGEPAWARLMTAPAVDSHYLYAYEGNYQYLITYNLSDGSMAHVITDSTPRDSFTVDHMYSTLDYPTLVTGRSNHIVAFDVPTNAMKWTQSGSFANEVAAVANGVIYIGAYSPLRLEARNEADGQLLWSWTPPGSNDKGFFGPALITNNLVFMSTDQRVYAIDLSTHKEVWSYNHPGKLAISSNGILYINRTAPGNDSSRFSSVQFPDSYLAAINLH